MRAALLLPALSLASVAVAAPAPATQEVNLDKRTYGLLCWFGWCDTSSSTSTSGAAASSSSVSCASVSSVKAASASLASIASVSSVSALSVASAAASLSSVSVASVASVSSVSVARKTSSTSAAAATSTSLVSSGHNWQHYSGSLGSGCSSVYTWQVSSYTCDGKTFADLFSALSYSCQNQRTLCNAAATWTWWNWWGFSYDDCTAQYNSCISQATSDCNSQTASLSSASRASIASVSSASVASGLAAQSQISIASVSAASVASGLAAQSKASIASVSAASVASGLAAQSKASIASVSAASVASGLAAQSQISIASVSAASVASGLAAQSQVSIASVSAASVASGLAAQSQISIASVSAASVASGLAAQSQISAASAASVLASQSQASVASVSSASIASVSATSVAAAATPTGIVSGTIPSGWVLASGVLVSDLVQSGLRVLTGSYGDSSSMTPSFCIEECSGRGYSLAGLEHGSECLCGNSLVNGGALSLTTTNAVMACAGDATLTCGASAGLQLYRNSAVLDSALNTIGAIVTSASASSSAAATSTSTSAAAAATSSAAVTTDNGYTSDLQCIAEIDGRLLKGASFTSDEMTWGLCTSYCANAGYTFAGVEYGRECYCDNSVSVYNPSTQCNSPCSGDSSKICGGGQALYIFEATSADATSQSLSNGWTQEQLCLAEVDGRLFSGASYSDTSAMTLLSCSNFCAANGFTQAGVEYGQECYCSSSVDLTTATKSTACNMACTGDQSENCGGGNALWVLTI